MTVGNPVRLIIRFMIPMFLGNIFQQFYNIVDSIVAGQFIGVDALEFIMAGATAVSVGTANFFNPYATTEIVDGLAKFMEQQKVEDINQLIGIVK